MKTAGMRNKNILGYVLEDMKVVLIIRTERFK